MKDIAIAGMLLIWMIFTLALVGSVIGMVLFISEGEKSTWMQIGFDLKEKLIK